jgi:hypothetical protein
LLDKCGALALGESTYVARHAGLGDTPKRLA